MKLLSENSFTKWAIIILICPNLFTLTMLWLEMTKRPEPFMKDGPPPPLEKLMKKELNLTDAQAKQFEQIREGHFEKFDAINTEISDLKKQILNEVLRQNPDTAKVNVLAERIGGRNAENEKAAFYHFHKLYMLCTPEQQQKLKIILFDMVGRIRPNDMPKHPGK